METNSKPNFLEKVKNFITLRFMLGIILGAVAGYCYYYFIGCSTGTCPITSNPVNMTLYGTLFGAVLSFGPRKTVKEEEK